jgi:hypothetical protein
MRQDVARSRKVGYKNLPLLLQGLEGGGKAERREGKMVK